MGSTRNFWAVFGPGVLFAGAAIGNSHLVQSTRAGAIYGLGLVSIILLAHLAKYPAYRFGPQYAVATGESLITGYLRLGKPIVLLFALVSFPVQIIVIAASAITTAAVGLAIFDLDLEAPKAAVIIIMFAALLLITGGYKLLDRLTKVFVAILTVSTLVATACALPSIQWNFEQQLLWEVDFKTFAFMIALMGFMPAGMELSVMNSLWTVSKRTTSGVTPNLGDVLLDFHIGYFGSVVLAFCFLLMGAGVMHAQGIEPAAGAAGFASQVIALYTEKPW